VERGVICKPGLEGRVESIVVMGGRPGRKESEQRWRDKSLGSHPVREMR
jgi:hypothetical protein